MRNFLKDLKTLLREVRLAHSISKKDLWAKLSASGHFELLNILRKVELKTVGFGTIIVPPSGFTDDEALNDKIIKWLHHKCVNVVDVQKQIREMEQCLK